MLLNDAACGEERKYKMLIIKFQRIEIYKVKASSNSGRGQRNTFVETETLFAVLNRLTWGKIF